MVSVTWVESAGGGSGPTASEGYAGVGSRREQVQYAAVDRCIGDAAAEGRLGAQLAAHHVAGLHAAHE